MKSKIYGIIITILFSAALLVGETTTLLKDIYMRDVCILPDPVSEQYYMIGSMGDGRILKGYTSKDLVHWKGPQTIYEVTDELWGDTTVVGIWAPEMHYYNGKYYLFLTFNTEHKMCEQWRNWLPRVARASQILVSDSPTGPFQRFENRSTTPIGMMTLDGTLWKEDGEPYMVFCHEWVQIKDGAIKYIKLKDDLSKTVGEPHHMMDGSDGPWVNKSSTYHCHVTDGPYFYTSKSGKLFMIWSSFGDGGYTVGLAISDSGKLKGPWRQQKEPVYSKNGGHGMLFETFDGQLMMVLHSPNKDTEQPHIFKMKDTGESLEVIEEFTGENK